MARNRMTSLQTLARRHDLDPLIARIPFDKLKFASRIGKQMKKPLRRTIFLFALVFASALGFSSGWAAETRFALVIGNDEYKVARLATPANDAGLMASALQAAGFTVTGARNLDQATLRESFREFLGQVAAAGPDAVAFVYLAGLGLQFEGDNYFVPVDADIQRDVDVPLQSIRVSDLLQPLAALPGRVKIVVLDAAKQNPFVPSGRPLASGLALVDPIPAMAIAFNAAPGTVGPQEQGPYGAYATSLTEMIAAGGLSLDDILARVRLRVSDLTQGAEVPWSVSAINGPFFMTELAAGAPPPPNVMPLAEIRSKPIREFPNAEDAYAAALERDSLEGYQQFLSIYPNTPYSHRVAAMLAIRREEIVWRRCVLANTPPAYWSYLRRYPRGPHAWDARRRLALIGAAPEPPHEFVLYDFGVPPPPPEEFAYIDRTVVIFEGPGYLPPPPPPLFFLPPRPREFGFLPPPPSPRERFGLPLPGPTVMPTFVRPPPAVALRPAPGAPPGPPGSHAPVSVSLPAAVVHGGPPSGGAESHRLGAAGGAIGVPSPPPAAAPPATALGKPAPLPPPAPPTGPTPTVAKPSPLPAPHPGPLPTVGKPAPTPPPPPAVGAAPALGKPVPPPPVPPSPPPAATTLPAVGKPVPPPPVPPPPATTVPTVGKPAPPPPPPQTGPAATVAKPAPLLPHPAPSPTVAKPAPPPPPPPPPPSPGPAALKPAPPPPPPPPPPAATVAKPAPPPPPPSPPPPGPAAAKLPPGKPPAKPACPAGQTLTPQGCK